MIQWLLTVSPSRLAQSSLVLSLGCPRELTRRAASCGTSGRNKGLLLFKVAPIDYAEVGGASCDGRIRNGALCPPVNLVSGVRGDIIGGAPERILVWEIASPSTLLRSCPLLVLGSFISKGGCYAWKSPPRSASSFLVPVAVVEPDVSRFHTVGMNVNS